MVSGTFDGEHLPSGPRPALLINGLGLVTAAVHERSGDPQAVPVFKLVHMVQNVVQPQPYRVFVGVAVDDASLDALKFVACACKLYKQEEVNH